MNTWLGAIADRHLYARPIDYRKEAGTDAIAPSSDGSDIVRKLREATDLFDRWANRDPGYWLKTKPMQLYVNGQGHEIVHLPYPMPVIREVRSNGILVARAPYVIIPDSQGDPLIRVDARIIDPGRYEGVTIQVANVSSESFDLLVNDSDGITREEFTGVTLTTDSEDYVRRRVNDESSFVVVIRKAREGSPVSGEYELEGGFNEYGFKHGKMKFISATNYTFEDGIKSVEVIGEVGARLSTPPAVRRATIRMADLIERDEIQEKEESRYHQSKSGRSQAPGYSGSHWVDLTVEEYTRHGSDSFYDIR